MNDESKYYEKTLNIRGYTLVPGKGFKQGEKLLIKPCQELNWYWMESDTFQRYNTLSEFVEGKTRRGTLIPNEETKKWLKQLQKNF